MKAGAATPLHQYRDQFLLNLEGFFKAHFTYLLATLVAAALDFASTTRFMSEGNIVDEVHPIIRGVSYVLGPFWGPLVGKLGQLVFLVLFAIQFRRWARVTFIVVTVIYIYAAWFNTWGIDLYTPRFFQFL